MHGGFEGGWEVRGCGWAGVGKTEQEELTCEGVGGEEVEAAGEACECHV